MYARYFLRRITPLQSSKVFTTTTFCSYADQNEKIIQSLQDISNNQKETMKVLKDFEKSFKTENVVDKPQPSNVASICYTVTALGFIGSYAYMMTHM